MITKINFTFFFLLVSLELFAQGKLYITPYTNCFVAAYKGIDSVNSKQSFIKTRNFMGKDFLMSINLTFIKDPFTISLGIEQGVYSSGYYHKEGKNTYPRVDSKVTLSQYDLIVYYTDFKYNLFGYNVKKPKKWLKKNEEKPYLLVSRFHPFIGAELRSINKTFEQDYPEGAEIATYLFNIPGTVYYHANDRKHFSMRAGFDWVFYDGEKRRFILTFMYKFAFKEAGYFRYHFEKPSRGIDFYYQTTTRGNGFSINAGIPIKLFEINKK